MTKELHTEIKASCMRLLSRREHSQSELLDKLKVKVVPLSDFDYIQFNPNSSKNLTTLMFTYLDLPKYFKTDKGKALSPEEQKEIQAAMMGH